MARRMGATRASHEPPRPAPLFTSRTLSSLRAYFSPSAAKAPPRPRQGPRCQPRPVQGPSPLDVCSLLAWLLRCYVRGLRNGAGT